MSVSNRRFSSQQRKHASKRLWYGNLLWFNNGNISSDADCKNKFNSNQNVLKNICLTKGHIIPELTPGFQLIRITLYLAACVVLYRPYILVIILSVFHQHIVSFSYEINGHTSVLISYISLQFDEHTFHTSPYNLTNTGSDNS
jgi:hypothetical protein